MSLLLDWIILYYIFNNDILIEAGLYILNIKYESISANINEVERSHVCVKS